MKIKAGQILRLILVSSIIFSLTGCDGSAAARKKITGNKSVASLYEAKLTKQDVTPFSTEFTNGMNKYGFEVLGDLYSDANISLSPASLELALLMASEGATGETHEEMLDALCMSDISGEEILGSVAQLMWRTNRNGMKTANSLWAQKDYSFGQDYLDICTKDFMADLASVDYENDASGATDAINDWVNWKTNGKVPVVFGAPVSEDTRMILVNSLYFLGEWADPFLEKYTIDQTFYGTSGEREVKFVHNTRDANYADGVTYQLLSLPFKGDSKGDGPFAMAFILPRPEASMEEVIAELNGDGFSAALAASSQLQVQISIPKFEFEFETSLVEIMQSRGMTLAFGDDADFSIMTDEKNDLYISDIIHKTYIRVDEKGAEASAVSFTLFGEKSAPMEPPVNAIFCADRPFIFAIYDTTDNTVLFTGITANP
jgi:serpin B